MARLIEWLKLKRVQHVWKSMSATGKMRGEIRCQKCGWNDTFWADGKYDAASTADSRIRGHILHSHPGDMIPENPFAELL